MKKIDINLVFWAFIFNLVFFISGTFFGYLSHPSNCYFETLEIVEVQPNIIIFNNSQTFYFERELLINNYFKRDKVNVRFCLIDEQIVIRGIERMGEYSLDG